MNEEFMLEAVSLLACFLFLLPFLIAEVFSRRKELDEFTRTKLMKVGRFAYDRFVKEDKSTAKQRTAKFMRDVYNSGELNNKYDLLSEISK